MYMCVARIADEARAPARIHGQRGEVSLARPMAVHRSPPCALAPDTCPWHSLEPPALAGMLRALTVATRALAMRKVCPQMRPAQHKTHSISGDPDLTTRVRDPLVVRAFLKQVDKRVASPAHARHLLDAFVGQRGW